MFEDSLECIDWFKSNGILVSVLTNGNANLRLCPDLGPRLHLSLTPEEIGAAKPSPVPFIAISQRSNIPTSRILFIGDSYKHDVEGALNTGMIACHLVRSFRNSSSIESVNSLENNEKYFVIESLNTTELVRKLANHLRNKKK